MSDLLCVLQPDETENNAVFNPVRSIPDLRPYIYSNTLRAKGTITSVGEECIVVDKYDFADKRFDDIFGERSAQSRKHLNQFERYPYR